MSRNFLLLGSILAFLSVALGAFGAHALKEKLSPDMLAVYQTGVQYQTWHSIALILVGILCIHADHKKLHVAGWLFTVGIVIFSGSLYALALSGIKMFGAITPIGGVCFLAGWLTFAVGAASLPAASHS